jgi:hypothetical protein
VETGERSAAAALVTPSAAIATPIGHFLICT